MSVEGSRFIRATSEAMQQQQRWSLRVERLRPVQRHMTTIMHAHKCSCVSVCVCIQCSM